MKSVFTPKQRQLLEDAIAAGYDVDIDGSGGEHRTYVVLSKRHGGRLVPVLEIWPDWTANRRDVSPELATNIRTLKAMREILFGREESGKGAEDEY